jgi:hypothetical protein
MVSSTIIQYGCELGRCWQSSDQSIVCWHRVIVARLKNCISTGVTRFHSTVNVATTRRSNVTMTNNEHSPHSALTHSLTRPQHKSAHVFPRPRSILTRSCWSPIVKRVPELSRLRQFHGDSPSIPTSACPLVLMPFALSSRRLHGLLRPRLTYKSINLSLQPQDDSQPRRQ